MQIQTDELHQVPQDFGHDGWLRKPAMVVTASSQDEEETFTVKVRLDYAEFDPMVEKWIGAMVSEFIQAWDTVTVRRLPGAWRPGV